MNLRYDSAALEEVSKLFRADMWRTVCEDAVIECGIGERWFGPVQVTVFEALPNAPLLNNVLGAAEPGAVENGCLAAAIEWADSFDVGYRVPVAQGRPGTAAAEAWLNHDGFEQGDGLVKYVRDASLPDLPGSPEITVWEIGQEEAHGETMVYAAEEALHLPASASSLLFGLPVQERWRTFTAELEGEIVSFGAVLIEGGVAELGVDATLEEARGRGCNQALLRERILAAVEAGCHTLFAELGTGEPEADAALGRNLLRAGFIPAYHSTNWRRPGLCVPVDLGSWESS
jgi:GNAT superfamily N-acetyltransferase